MYRNLTAILFVFLISGCQNFPDSVSEKNLNEQQPFMVHCTLRFELPIWCDQWRV